ncbi:MFS transporter [Deinococcus aestuarii]|uniref:MFS transporter n=1 Tax=Deinococcus aestuarii TaxID=2774531 RepID=UPI001C0CEC37
MTARLRPRDKLLYGPADFGGNLVGVVGNTWLLYYLVNIAGLAPLPAGLAFLAGRLFDALVDPAIGALSDRLRERRGRLWFTRVFAVPAGLVFAALWLIPYVEGTPARFVLAALGFMALSALYSLATIPYLALGPELTPDSDERTSLNSYRLAFSMLATLVGVALPPLLVLGLTGARDLAASPPGGWLVVGVLCAAAASSALLVTGFGVREPVRTRRGEESPPLTLRAVRELLGTFGLKPLLGVFVLVTVALTITNSILPFFLESVLRLPGALQAPLLGGLFVVAILGFAGWAWLSARIGKRAGVMLGLGLMVVSLLLYVYAVPRGVVSPSLIGTIVVNGLGLAAVSLFPWAMLPDVLEFDELRSGLRREGLLYALLLFALKAAGSFGVFSNALVTSLLGYVPGSAAQSPETVRGIALMMGPVPCLLYLLALVFAWRYPITRENHAEARADLAARATPPAPPGPRPAPAPLGGQEAHD